MNRIIRLIHHWLSLITNLTTELVAGTDILLL